MDARMEELIHTDPLVWKAHAGRISEYDLILAMGNRHVELKKELMDLQAKCTCQINSIFINSTKKKK